MQLFLVFEAAILAVGFEFLNAEKGPWDEPALSVCGTEGVVRLAATGTASSALLALERPPGAAAVEGRRSRVACRLRVSVPADTHLLYLRLLEAPATAAAATPGDEVAMQPCPLHVYVPENELQAVWSEDACGGAAAWGGGVLVREAGAEVVWVSPGARDPRHRRLQRRRLLAVAVGRGEWCARAGPAAAAACLQLGAAATCVARALACDGVPHCPLVPARPLLGDEEAALCGDDGGWERLAAGLLQHLGAAAGAAPPPRGSLLPAVHATQASPAVPAAERDTVSGALAHYGPWGYLLLAMLACGGVLASCGLWECCCRRAKPARPPPPPSTTSCTAAPDPAPDPASPDTTPPPPPPPSYEDLDQPPSYTALFPEERKTPPPPPPARPVH